MTVSTSSSFVESDVRICPCTTKNFEALFTIVSAFKERRSARVKGLTYLGGQSRLQYTTFLKFCWQSPGLIVDSDNPRFFNGVSERLANEMYEKVLDNVSKLIAELVFGNESIVMDAAKLAPGMKVMFTSSSILFLPTASGNRSLLPIPKLLIFLFFLLDIAEELKDAHKYKRQHMQQIPKAQACVVICSFM